LYYFKVHKKSIEKIISQNAQIDSKLEKLIAGQKKTWTAYHEFRKKC